MCGCCADSVLYIAGAALASILHETSILVCAKAAHSHFDQEALLPEQHLQHSLLSSLFLIEA